METLLLWIAKHIDIMGEDLRRVAPEEGCGLILKSQDFRWLQLENTLHSPVAYTIDAREWMLAESRGEQVMAIVHSHVNCADNFSRRDLGFATVKNPQGKTEAIFPNVDYLVIAIKEGTWESATLYRFEKTTGNYLKIWQSGNVE